MSSETKRGSEQCVVDTQLRNVDTMAQDHSQRLESLRNRVEALESGQHRHERRFRNLGKVRG